MTNLFYCFSQPQTPVERRCRTGYPRNAANLQKAATLSPVFASSMLKRWVLAACLKNDAFVGMGAKN